MLNQFEFKGANAKAEALQQQVKEAAKTQNSLENQRQTGSSVGTLEQSKEYVYALLDAMIASKGSDMFLTAGFPPAMKLNGAITRLSDAILTKEHTAAFARSIMTDRHFEEFSDKNECNFAIVTKTSRFRVNAFKQQGRVGLVMRVINTEIPQLSSLGVPEGLKNIIMEKRGLIIVVGATGSGKSTTLAAMIGHRNQTSPGHIITIEDPIEFVHPHNKCVVTQREVGIDTDSWDAALKNTLRQAPDVIMIGEVRTKETMEHAIAFAETGHLVLCTLHANNANQALDRVINFFPEERKQQLLMDLSQNVRGIVAQQLLPTLNGKSRRAALDILLCTPLIQDFIREGELHRIKEVMKESTNLGMQTFDQALFNLYQTGEISYEEALRHADSENEVRLRIKLSQGGTAATLSQGLDGVELSRVK